jgi:hypothetical protein
MKYIYSLLVGLFLTGCATSDVIYNSEMDLSKTDMQIVSHEECIYLIGPFSVSEELTIEKAIESTVIQANKDGFDGNKLINVKVKENVISGLITSKQCLYIEGNLVYEEDYTF